MSEDKSAGRKIRTLNDLHNIFDRGFFSLDAVIDYLDYAVDRLPEIVGRNIGCHTYRNTGRTVYEKVGITAGKYCGLILRSVEVGNEVYGVLVDIGKKLHGDLGKSCFGISHCRSSVTVHGTEVSVTVDERISH